MKSGCARTRHNVKWCVIASPTCFDSHELIDDDNGGKITLVGKHFGNAVNTNYVCSNPLQREKAKPPGKRNVQKIMTRF